MLNFIGKTYKEIDNTTLFEMLFCMLSAFFISRIMITAILLLVPNSFDAQKAVIAMFEGNTPGITLLAIFLSILIEEVLFRFIAYNLLKLTKRFTKVPYSLAFFIYGFLGSFIWGFAHTSYALPVKITVLLIGFLLFIIYEKTSKEYGQALALPMVILLHFLLDISSILLIKLL